jgi:hypothetical protein
LEWSTAEDKQKKEWMKQAMVDDDTDSDEATTCNSPKVDHSEFFDAEDDDQPEQSCSRSVAKQLEKYLEKGPEPIDAINVNYPKLRPYFLRYNTALPSSASVERLFSRAKEVLTSNRTRLSDANLERLVLLMCNTDVA